MLPATALHRFLAVLGPLPLQFFLILFYRYIILGSPAYRSSRLSRQWIVESRMFCQLLPEFYINQKLLYAHQFSGKI